MNHNLLIVGAGVYGMVAKEIAHSMNCFDRIAFVDDGHDRAPDGTKTIGTTKDLSCLSKEYSHVIVAIGNVSVRQKMMQIIEETSLELTTLVSPRAYIAPSARLGKGCIIEPMSVVHTDCVLGKGCFICAGAVVNHASSCGDFVQVDCNATVAGSTVVPSGAKILSGTIYRNEQPL